MFLINRVDQTQCIPMAIQLLNKTVQHVTKPHGLNDILLPITYIQKSNKHCNTISQVIGLDRNQNQGPVVQN